MLQCIADGGSTDVTDYARLKATFDQVVADFGRIDGL